MNQRLLAKEKLAALIDLLAAGGKLVGPMALGAGQFTFGEVCSLDEMALPYLPTILPPKKYFLPPHEPLLNYDTSAGQNMVARVEVEALTLFGVHTCDLAGILCLNLVFAERPQDVHYLLRERHITLIGLECADYCDDHASCAMLRHHLPKGGYDLFLSELDDAYFVDINTQKGEQIVEETGLFAPVTPQARKQLQQLRSRKKQLFRSEVPIRYQDLPRLLAETADSPVWRQLGERCLACGNCTAVCPTCYCFDVQDESEFDLSKGQRVRVWDSCQHEDFAKVAGGESFRQERSDRQRHRFNRKFNYPMARYRRLFCTGCGRCSRTCMAKIDLKETLNALLSERG